MPAAVAAAEVGPPPVREPRLAAPEQPGAQCGLRLAALCLVAGQELVVSATRLGTQTGSVYEKQLSSPMLTLVSGTAVPLVLMVLGVDLFLRREVKRHRSRDAGAALADDRPRRRKKRHRSNRV